MSEYNSNSPYAKIKESDSLWVMFRNLVTCTFQTVFGYICLDICVAVSLHYISKG